MLLYSLFGDSENMENNYLKIRDLLSIALFNILRTHYLIHIWVKVVKEIIQIIKNNLLIQLFAFNCYILKLLSILNNNFFSMFIFIWILLLQLFKLNIPTLKNFWFIYIINAHFIINILPNFLRYFPYIKIILRYFPIYFFRL